MGHGAPPREHWHHTIPLGMHGDGGSFSHHDSLFVVSWNTLISGEVGGGFSILFLFTILRKADLTSETWPELWRVFGWSLNHLLTGITPATDWNKLQRPGGEQFIAENWRAALIQIRGDWEFMSQVIGMPWHNENLNMCWL